MHVRNPSVFWGGSKKRRNPVQRGWGWLLSPSAMVDRWGRLCISGIFTETLLPAISLEDFKFVLKFEIQVHDISKSMHTSSLVPDFDEENEFITVVVKVIYARRKKRRRTCDGRGKVFRPRLQCTLNYCFWKGNSIELFECSLHLLKNCFRNLHPHFWNQHLIMAHSVLNL